MALPRAPPGRRRRCPCLLRVPAGIPRRLCLCPGQRHVHRLGLVEDFMGDVNGMPPWDVEADAAACCEFPWKSATSVFGKPRRPARATN
eukprot:7932040-Alexandrium_andersonii.AAC.1